MQAAVSVSPAAQVVHFLQRRSLVGVQAAVWNESSTQRRHGEHTVPFVAVHFSVSYVSSLHSAQPGAT